MDKPKVAIEKQMFSAGKLLSVYSGKKKGKIYTIFYSILILYIFVKKLFFGGLNSSILLLLFFYFQLSWKYAEDIPFIFPCNKNQL